MPTLADAGAAGRAHIAARLSNGLTLSKLVRDLVGSWETGVFLSDGRQAPPDLEYGGVVAAGGVRDYALSFIATRAAGKTFIAEDWLAQPSDPAVQRSRNYFVFRQEIYHVAASQPTAADVDAALRDAQAAHGVAFFAVHWPANEPHPARAAEVQTDLLEALATRVTLVGVDAYDGETYAIAQPN